MCLPAMLLRAWGQKLQPLMCSPVSKTVVTVITSPVLVFKPHLRDPQQLIPASHPMDSAHPASWLCLAWPILINTEDS